MFVLIDVIFLYRATEEMAKLKGDSVSVSHFNLTIMH